MEHMSLSISLFSWSDVKLQALAYARLRYLQVRACNHIGIHKNWFKLLVNNVLSHAHDMIPRDVKRHSEELRSITLNIKRSMDKHKKIKKIKKINARIDHT